MRPEGLSIQAVPQLPDCFTIYPYILPVDQSEAY